MSKLRVGTLFSGIGAFEWALKRLGVDYEVVFACDNGDVDIEVESYDELLKKSKQTPSVLEMKKLEEEVYAKARKTNFVEKSYKANFDIADENFHYNVCILDGEKYAGKVDILVGGSPCQAFSIMGYKRIL